MLNPPWPLQFSSWDLSPVLKGPPFKPLQSAELHPLSLKTTLLLAIASVKRMGDLQALSVCASSLEFGPNDCKVILKPRHGYVPIRCSLLCSEVDNLKEVTAKTGLQQGTKHCCN